jgi:hypothetical protein
MTKGHLAMTRWQNGRERERKLSRISKVRALHPLSLLRGLGISYPVSKYFVAATITRLRIARIAFSAQRDPLPSKHFGGLRFRCAYSYVQLNFFGWCGVVSAGSAGSCGVYSSPRGYIVPLPIYISN